MVKMKKIKCKFRTMIIAIQFKMYLIDKKFKKLKRELIEKYNKCNIFRNCNKKLRKRMKKNNKLESKKNIKDSKKSC